MILYSFINLNYEWLCSLKQYLNVIIYYPANKELHIQPLSMQSGWSSWCVYSLIYHISGTGLHYKSYTGEELWMKRKYVKVRQDLKPGNSVSGVQTNQHWIVAFDFSPPVWAHGSITQVLPKSNPAFLHLFMLSSFLSDTFSICLTDELLYAFLVRFMKWFIKEDVVCMDHWRLL